MDRWLPRETWSCKHHPSSIPDSTLPEDQTPLDPAALSCAVLQHSFCGFWLSFPPSFPSLRPPLPSPGIFSRLISCLPNSPESYSGCSIVFFYLFLWSTFDPAPLLFFQFPVNQMSKGWPKLGRINRP
ncbi:hypothetical protein BDV40DRAFT_7723 [Aspergillus tamarii]|uniref:Uncharacterized protein n=1 Tax=Aspergillus tamarii TaxID=41984 RepID=A0A5N6UJN8_ASPTM|nr:hypothetical protein BDV40DRAFT_7723 [Aspergillus tamarii]